MDSRRFDSLARSLAAPRSRRGFLAGVAKIAVAALGGLRGAGGAAAAQVTQAQCGNVTCKTNPGRCAPSCVCCVYGNGNSRCRPPGNCSGGSEQCPADRPYFDSARGCVQCLDASQCSAPAGACAAAICTNGVCGAGPAQAGTICRQAQGPCDLAETCTGSSTDCPPDAKLADTTPCDADGDACTVGDACQAGVCVPGLPRECRPCQECSGGDCVTVATDTRCPAGCCGGICCRDDETCVDQVCQAAACITVGNICNTTDNQCCAADPTCAQSCSGVPTCCRQPGGICTTTCDCCGTSAQCLTGACCIGSPGACDADTDCCGDLVCNEGTCQEFCLAAGTACTSSTASLCCDDTACTGIETQVCDQPFGTYCVRGPLEACASDCECGVFFPKVAPYVGTACENGRCCLPLGRTCGTAADCCQSGPPVVCQASDTPGTADGTVCCIPDGGPCSDPLHFCCNGACIGGQCVG